MAVVEKLGVWGGRVKLVGDVLLGGPGLEDVFWGAVATFWRFSFCIC